jgi:nickel transport protein
MRSIALAVIFSLIWVTDNAMGHDLQYSVRQGTAVVVRLQYADTGEFSYESYEIFREGEDLPYQVGRTDAKGAIAFVPDRGGVWRIRTFSEDGHGLDVTIDVDDDQVLHLADRSLFDRYERIIVGIALLFGIFGTINLYTRRKKK